MLQKGCYHDGRKCSDGNWEVVVNTQKIIPWGNKWINKFKEEKSGSNDFG